MGPRELDHNKRLITLAMITLAMITLAMITLAMITLAMITLCTLHCNYYAAQRFNE